MAQTTLHNLKFHDNPIPPANPGTGPFATVHYASKDGHTMSIGNLEASLQYIIGLIGDAMEALEKREHGAARDFLNDAMAEADDMLPDFEALAVEPDPIIEAETLLAGAYRRAQDFLAAETERRRQARQLQYAFAIPGYIASGILTTLCPGLSPDEFAEREAQLEKLLDGYGWSLEKNLTNPAWIENHCAPLRQLQQLLERHSACPVTGHVLEAMEHALRWCENTSYNHLSPISGRADGIAPEGVLYPRLSLELVRFERRRDIPKEWAGPLVKSEAGEVAEC